MRVCHVWQNFFPLEGGGLERYIIDLSDYLSQRNPDTHFLLLTNKSRIPFLRARKIPKYQRFNSLEVYRMGPNLLSVFENVLLQWFRIQSRLLDNVSTLTLYHEVTSWREINNIDIFHVHGIWDTRCPIIGLLLSQRFHRPLVVSLHGDMVGSLAYQMPLERPESTEVLKHAKAIITYSRKVLNALNACGLGYKSHLIPNFVNVGLFSRPTSLNGGVGTKVVMVSRLDPFKDPITVIQAFRYVKNEVPEATLQVVGYGQLYDRLKLLIHTLHLDDAVFLLGRQTNVKRFLWNNDIFVTGDAYISVLEAWSAGLAVIATDAETNRQIISNGKDGILVPPKNPQKLASALLKIMKNNKLRIALASNGLETAKSYDISSVAPMVASIYESVLEK
jgi:glycosyltransferase involved in cell wall biosynthesis